MPRILQLSEHEAIDYPRVVREQIARLRPGQLIIITDWARELNCDKDVLTRQIPKTHLAKKWLRGFTTAVRVLICPEPTKRQRPSKKK